MRRDRRKSGIFIGRGKPCVWCGQHERDHIWRCSECGEALPRDVDGLPVFEGHGLFAALCCPPEPKDLN